eukprot:COSAG02_NODE_979_length_15497_cov_5.029549_6_plen_74_part_00
MGFLEGTSSSCSCENPLLSSKDERKECGNVNSCLDVTCPFQSLVGGEEKVLERCERAAGRVVCQRVTTVEICG